MGVALATTRNTETMTLSPLEMAVAVLLARQVSQCDSNPLVDQLNSAQVSARESTSFGFLTEFNVDRRLPPMQLTDGPAGWVRSEVGPNGYPLEFMLHVRDGYAEMILAFSLHEGYGDLDLLTATFTDPRIFNPNSPSDLPWSLAVKKPATAKVGGG